MGETTEEFKSRLEDLEAGRPGAARALIDRAYPRLRSLAGKILRESFPGIRDLDMDEVVAEAYGPLATALAADSVTVATGGDFFRLAAHKFRQTLLNLVAAAGRRPPTVPLDRGGDSSDGSGGGLDPGTRSGDPARLATWTELHRQVELLPEDIRAVFVQHFYLGLTQAEIAEAAGLPAWRVSRLWAKALVLLSDYIPDIG